MKRQYREAAKVILKEARSNIKTMFATHGAARERTRGGKTLAQETKVSVRSRRGRIRAEVGAGGQPGAYGKVHEEGRTVSRKSRSGGTHQASYKAVPWLSRAVSRSRAEVFRRIGKSFEVV